MRFACGYFVTDDIAETLVKNTPRATAFSDPDDDHDDQIRTFKPGKWFFDSSDEEYNKTFIGVYIDIDSGCLGERTLTSVSSITDWCEKNSEIAKKIFNSLGWSIGTPKSYIFNSYKVTEP